MAEFVKLNPNALTELRQMNPRLISYNVEMTEVTGGTFWKAYTDAQIDGTEQVPPPDFSKGVAAMHQWYDPIDTTNPRLIKLAKALGSCWVRVPAPGPPEPIMILMKPAFRKVTSITCTKTSGSIC
jgi:hypothetical protein